MLEGDMIYKPHRKKKCWIFFSNRGMYFADLGFFDKIVGQFYAQLKRYGGIIL